MKPHLVEFSLGLSGDLGPVLAGIDVEGESIHARLLQLRE